MATRKWQSVVKHALKRNRPKSVKKEWRKFSLDKIRFLEDIADLQMPLSDILARYNSTKMFIEDHEDFPQQCLVASIDQEEKFWPLIEHFEDLFDNHGSDLNLSGLSHFYQSLMFKLLELNKPDILHEVLSHLEVQQSEFSVCLK